MRRNELSNLLCFSPLYVFRFENYRYPDGFLMTREREWKKPPAFAALFSNKPPCVNRTSFPALLNFQPSGKTALPFFLTQPSPGWSREEDWDVAVCKPLCFRWILTLRVALQIFFSHPGAGSPSLSLAYYRSVDMADDGNLLGGVGGWNLLLPRVKNKRSKSWGFVKRWLHFTPPNSLAIGLSPSIATMWQRDLAS
jgi:hypothetical protein